MRYQDFKLIETRFLSESEADEALPSKVMNKAELSKDDRKYVRAIAKSIREKKPFAFLPPGKAVKSKAGTFGVIDKIEYDSKPLDVDQWEEWASDPKTPIENVLNTEFYMDGDVYQPNRMWKTEAATGEMSINKGDAAEAILGAAIAAKFKLGGREVNSNDVVDILKEVVARGKSDGITDYQKAEVEDDSFKFVLTLNSKSMKSLKMWIEADDPMTKSREDLKIVQEGVKPDTIKDLQEMISNTVVYANKNKRCIEAVEIAKDEPEKNEVVILSDGGDATQQNTTKVDLKLSYDGKPTRLLSLKAGSVKQFGQASGATWKSASDFFESVFKLRLPDSMKQKFGFKDISEPDYKEYNYNEGPFAKLYSEMAKQVSEYTKGDNTKLEFNLVKNVYDAINYHATRGQEGVTMVIVSPKAKVAYKELAFDVRLLAALELYDLEVINEPGLSNHRISVVGQLKSDEAKKSLGDGAKKLPSKNILVQLRTAFSGGAIRNLVEMGELLKDLADVEKLDQQEAQAGTEPEVDSNEPTEPQEPNDPNAKI